MLCHGLTQEQVAETWVPFLKWVSDRPEDFTLAGNPLLIALPARDFWDPAALRRLPGIVMQDERPGKLRRRMSTGQAIRGEAAQFLHAYQSAWLPNRLLSKARRGELATALANAGNEWTITLHCNKGLGGGSPEAIAADARDRHEPGSP